MPNLPPGTDQSVNPAVTPTWVFSPLSNKVSTLRLTNTGPYTVWAGGANVSQFNGFPVPPGSKPLELQNVGSTVYTCSNVSPTGDRVHAGRVGAGRGVDGVHGVGVGVDARRRVGGAAGRGRVAGGRVGLGDGRGDDDDVHAGDGDAV